MYKGGQEIWLYKPVKLSALGHGYRSGTGLVTFGILGVGAKSGFDCSVG